jgi:hypothetical protein
MKVDRPVVASSKTRPCRWGRFLQTMECESGTFRVMWLLTKINDGEGKPCLPASCTEETERLQVTLKVKSELSRLGQARAGLLMIVQIGKIAEDLDMDVEKAYFRQAVPMTQGEESHHLRMLKNRRTSLSNGQVNRACDRK